MVKSETHGENILTHLENKRIESQTPDYPLLQDPHHHGVKLGLRNYLVSKIYMCKFGGNDPITRIFHMEQF
jgi:hypothetical protein